MQKAILAPTAVEVGRVFSYMSVASIQVSIEFKVLRPPRRTHALGVPVGWLIQGVLVASGAVILRLGVMVANGVTA